MRTILRKH